MSNLLQETDNKKGKNIFYKLDIKPDMGTVFDNVGIKVVIDGIDIKQKVLLEHLIIKLGIFPGEKVLGLKNFGTGKKEDKNDSIKMTRGDSSVNKVVT